MSRQECTHGNWGVNCTECIVEQQEADGKRDAQGVLHSDNGQGWCVGHVEGPGDGRCTVLVRHCEVLNTPEQVQANLQEDHRVLVAAASAKVDNARRSLGTAERELHELNCLPTGKCSCMCHTMPRGMTVSHLVPCCESTPS